MKYGVTLAAGLAAGRSLGLGSTRRAAADVVDTDLVVLPGERVMIDGVVVPFLGFGSTADRLELPGPQLEVQVGDTVHVTLRNRSGRRVGLAVPGLPGVDGTPVDPGRDRVVTFAAPAEPGTHCYVGAVDGSVDTGRALGATGPLVVLPRGDRRSTAALFPRLPATRRQALLGTVPAPPLPAAVVQERTWVFAEVNPTTARDLAGGRITLPSDPEPEYFLVNGLSGMLAVEDHATLVAGRAGGLGGAGDATLLRMVNTGRAPRSVHTHGTHVWVLSHPDTPWLVGSHKDTVRVPPASVVDVLLPFETPPDSFPVTSRGQRYVVHDHIEMAETASGGHYPGGMVSDLVLV